MPEQNTKTPLQTYLATVAPQIELSTLWTPDTLHPSEIRKKMIEAYPWEWQAWQVEIQARAISGGKLASSLAYRCSVWVKRKIKPWENPSYILGCEIAMTEEALSELASAIPAEHHDMQNQIAAAVEATRNQSSPNAPN